MNPNTTRILSALALFASPAFLVSCSDEHDAHEHAEQAEHADHADHADHESTGKPLEGLSLNNGDKWEMDDHTRTSFAAMAATFASKDHAAMSTDDLKELGTSLRTDINGLIQGCTMTGDSHNQLHVFLTGYIAAVDELTESGQLQDAVKIKQFLHGYTEFFE
jgi:hypothetical protein